MRVLLILGLVIFCSFEMQGQLKAVVYKITYNYVCIKVHITNELHMCMHLYKLYNVYFINKTICVYYILHFTPSYLEKSVLLEESRVVSNAFLRH